MNERNWKKSWLWFEVSDTSHSSFRDQSWRLSLSFSFQFLTHRRLPSFLSLNLLHKSSSFIVTSRVPVFLFHRNVPRFFIFQDVVRLDFIQSNSLSSFLYYLHPYFWNPQKHSFHHNSVILLATMYTVDFRLEIYPAVGYPRLPYYKFKQRCISP